MWTFQNTHHRSNYKRKREKKNCYTVNRKIDDTIVAGWGLGEKTTRGGSYLGFPPDSPELQAVTHGEFRDAVGH